ncbi:MAG: 6-phosphofructokinase [Chloroflexi bacterium]|nr:MAG: 6-phosphofructokinase [Chloroflexota bacterium]
MKRIGVLTSGGDNPGLNPCIRAVVRMGIHMGLSVMGIRRGYAGLVGGEIHEMDARSVGGIIGRGGTILGTARCPEFYEPKGRKEALRTLNRFGLDGLVIIGGNGSLTGALELYRMGFPVIGVPSTIDNDVNGTDISIGVDTALNTILDAIDKIKDTASSHNRAFLIETMGRNSGYLAVASGIAGGAELVLCPEEETTFKEVVETVEDAYIRGKAHCIIVVAEGWQPGTQELATHLRERQEELGFSVRVTQLGHVQRGGAASAFDRILATRLGAASVRELSAGNAGHMVGWVKSAIKLTPLEEAVAFDKELSPSLLELADIMEK